MRFLTEKIDSLNVDWNKRPLTETDFYRLCRRYKITVKLMPLTIGGFYYRVMGRDFIAVDSRLKGTEQLEVLFHELGHFLFHVPESGVTANFHGLVRGTRQEREANIFALCALIPKWWIEQRPPSELIDDEGLLPDMIEQRTRILFDYGI